MVATRIPIARAPGFLGGESGPRPGLQATAAAGEGAHRDHGQPSGNVALRRSGLRGSPA